MSVSKYDHVIWDWNGTLLDDAWLCVEIMNAMRAKRELSSINLEVYRNIFSFPVKDYYARLGFNFDREPFEEVGMEFMALYNRRQKECRLHDEVPGVLRKVTEIGFSQSILSAREQNELRIETKEREVDSFFSFVYGLDDHYAHGKRDAGIRLMNDLGISRRRLLFVGDTLHDSEVAKELGIDCVLIPNGHQSRERLSQSGYPVIHSPGEIPALL
jgi:phosphoglycolate phosphatase